MVYAVDDIDPKEQLKNGISAIDLGICKNIIKDYYNISQEESFIVVSMETKINKTDENENNNDNSFNLGKNMNLEIYDFSGNKLNLSICQENIKVMKYIGDVVEELNIQSAIDLAHQGIDVFNTKDKFFNDLCYYYDNQDGKDITINDRRKDIYKNVTFCEDGCTYDGIDYELMIANCICDSNILQNDDSNNNKADQNVKSEKINFDSISKSFISSFYDFNFKVLKCYNLILNLKILKKNLGFYMLIMLLLQILFLIIHMIKGLKSIKYYMILFETKDFKKNLISLKKINNDTQKLNYNYKKKRFNDDTSNNERIRDNSNKMLFIKDNISNHNNLKNYLQTNNNLMIEKKSYIKNKINNKDIHQIKDINSRKKNNEILLKKFNNNNLFNGKNIIQKGKKFNKNHKIYTHMKKKVGRNKFESKNFLTNLYPIIEELQDINYEKAIIYDKRNYLRIFLAYLVDKQIIFETFCTENYLYLFIIKCSFFVYNLQINFFLNSPFYTDEYISNAYYNNGVLDFISGLPKSIYSSMSTLITTNLLRILSNNKDELRRLIKEKRNDKNYKDFINIKLKKLKYKLIVFFMIVFILGIFFSYYVTAFCSVYRYSQKYLIYGFFESFALDFFISIIISIFLSLLRYISIKKRAKYLFQTSNIINLFL